MSTSRKRSRDGVPVEDGVQALKGHTDHALRVIGLPESRLIVTACSDGRVRIFTQDGDGTPLYDLDARPGDGHFIDSWDITPLGRDVVALAGSGNGCISTWLASSGVFLDSLKLPDLYTGVRVLSAAGSGRDCLVAGCNNEEVVFISHSEGRKLRMLSAEPCGCGIITDISINGDVIAVGGVNTVRVFSATTRKPIGSLGGGRFWFPSSVSVSKRFMATASHDTVLLCSNVAGFPLVEELKERVDNIVREVDAIALVGDALLLSSSSGKLPRGGFGWHRQCRLFFRSLPSCELLAYLDVEIERMESLTVTADGRIVCVGQGDRKALIVNPPARVAAAIKKYAVRLFSPFSNKSVVNFMRARSLGLKASLE